MYKHFDHIVGMDARRSPTSGRRAPWWRAGTSPATSCEYLSLFNMHKKYKELEVVFSLQEHFGDSGRRKGGGSQFALWYRLPEHDEAILLTQWINRRQDIAMYSGNIYCNRSFNRNLFSRHCSQTFMAQKRSTEGCNVTFLRYLFLEQQWQNKKKRTISM